MRIPFPFFGAGDAAYFEWAFVEVWFARAPGAKERARIAKDVPAPIGRVKWTGRLLETASHQFVHDDISATYGGKRPRYPEDPDDRSFATSSQCARFNAAIEAWLIAAHAICPITFAYRRADSEAGGTKLSRWHTASLEALAAILPELKACPDDSTVYGVLAYALDAKKKLPAWAREIVEPGKREAKLLRAGDGAALREALAGKQMTADFVEAFITRAKPKFDDANAKHRRALLDVADRVLEVAPLPHWLWHPLARSAAREKKHPRSKAVLAAMLDRVGKDHGLIDSGPWIGVSLHQLGAGDIADKLMHKALDPALVKKNRAGGVTPYLAPLRMLIAICDEKQPKLLVPAASAKKLLDKCLPGAKLNPNVHWAAACVYLRLGKRDLAFDQIERGVADDEVRKRIASEADFKPLKTDKRWMAIFKA